MFDDVMRVEMTLVRGLKLPYFESHLFNDSLNPILTRVERGSENSGGGGEPPLYNF